MCLRFIYTSDHGGKNAVKTFIRCVFASVVGRVNEPLILSYQGILTEGGRLSTTDLLTKAACFL